MTTGVVVAAATVVLLAGCAGSGGAGETVTVTASESSSGSSSRSSSVEPASESGTSASSSSTVDCADETLTQAEWIDNCSDSAGFPEGGDSEGVEEPAGVKLGAVHKYPDGLLVKVSNWRQGSDEYVDGPFVLFDVTVENTGSQPISVDFFETAVYGPTGLEASSVGSEQWEDSSRRLQPGAKDTITLDLDVSDATLPATLLLEFYDEETYEAPRAPLHVEINGGVQ